MAKNDGRRMGKKKHFGGFRQPWLVSFLFTRNLVFGHNPKPQATSLVYPNNLQ